MTTDWNTAALSQYEADQVKNEIHYEIVKSRAPTSDLMAQAEDRMWDDYGFNDGLTDHNAIVIRLALWSANCRDLLPADYGDTQKVLDEAWLSTYSRTFIEAQFDTILERWIEDNWHD